MTHGRIACKHGAAAASDSRCAAGSTPAKSVVVTASKPTHPAQQPYGIPPSMHMLLVAGTQSARHPPRHPPSPSPVAPPPVPSPSPALPLPRSRSPQLPDVSRPLRSLHVGLWRRQRRKRHQGPGRPQLLRGDRGRPPVQQRGGAGAATGGPAPAALLGGGPRGRLRHHPGRGACCAVLRRAVPCCAGGARARLAPAVARGTCHLMQTALSF